MPADVILSVSETRQPHIRVYMSLSINDTRIYKYEWLGGMLTDGKGIHKKFPAKLGVFAFEIMRRQSDKIDWPDVFWRFFRSMGTPASQNFKLIALVLKEMSKAASKLKSYEAGEPEFGYMLFHKMLSETEIELYEPTRVKVNTIDVDDLIARDEMMRRHERDLANYQPGPSHYANLPEEVLAENRSAKARARQLLDSIATKNNDSDTYYTVQSRLWSDVVYRVYDDSGTWIDVFYKDEFAGGLCLVVQAPHQPTGNIVRVSSHGLRDYPAEETAYEDQLIQKLLMLRYDETRVWRVANYGVWSRVAQMTVMYTARYNKLTQTLTFLHGKHKQAHIAIHQDDREEGIRSRRNVVKKRSYFLETLDGYDADRDKDKKEYYL